MTTLGTMRHKLLSIADIHDRLRRTEPVTSIPFTVGNDIRFHAQPGATHGLRARPGPDPIAVYATIGTTEYQLTRDSLEQACQAIGLRREHVADCPAELLVPHLNYFMREGLLAASTRKRDFQFLTNGTRAIHLGKQGPPPLSNVTLLETAVDSITRRFGSGSEVLADYKTRHSLNATTLRLIIPGRSRDIISSTPSDTWSIGIQIRNSLTGAKPTTAEGYLFRWTCTNGQIDTRYASGPLTRRADITEAEAYQWARQAVDDILNGLETAFDAVQSLTAIGIDSLADVLRDVFEHHRIPLTHRPAITEALVMQDGDITMYDVMNAITSVANNPDLEPNAVESLMRIGGDLPYTGDKRCGTCRRMLHQH